MRLYLFPILLIFALPLYADEPKTVTFTLSPETTYLMEPQLPDGRIDYLTVLNAQLSSQTTPENNLLIGVFSLVLGEREEAFLRDHEAQTDEQKAGLESLRKYHEQFWTMLGLDAPLPLDSLVACHPVAYTPSLSAKNYEQELREFYSEEELAHMIEQIQEREKKEYKDRFDAGKITKERYDSEIKKIETEMIPWYYREIVSDQWDASLRRPWTAEEYPYLARWMATTDDWTPKLLDIARNRTDYYHPLISESGSLFYDVLLPYVQSLRMAARHFQSRGNFEFARGNVDDAMECAFAPIRMGRTLRKSSPTIVEDLVGIAMSGMGTYQLTTQLAILPKDKDAAWILQKKREYDAIEVEMGSLPFPPIWCLAERFGMLSAIQTTAVEPKRFRGLYAGWGWDEEWCAKYDKLFCSGKEYDWNEVMKQVNLFYDDFEDFCLLPSSERRFRAAKRLDLRAKEAGERSADSQGSPEQQVVDFMLGNFFFSAEPALIALTRGEWVNRVTSVAFALAAYRADNDGNSPDTLEQLVPKYLDSVPDSPFTDKPLRYIKRQNDVLIANDDKYKLDGSEKEVEKMIAEAKPGSYAYPSAQHFVFIVTKSE